MTDDQKRFLEQIRNRLDESSANLDADTLARLRECRKQALAGEPASADSTLRSWYRSLTGIGSLGERLPVAAYLLGSVAVVSVAGWLLLSRPAELQDLSALGNLDLLSAAEEPEFYEQLDFYLWMEHENEG